MHANDPSLTDYIVQYVTYRAMEYTVKVFCYHALRMYAKAANLAMLKSAVSGTDPRIHTTKKTWLCCFAGALE